MKFKYLTIEREYGSGASIIAKLLSDETNIPCYGREIIEQLSDEYAIPVENIEQYEEAATSSFLYSLFALGKMQDGDFDMLSTDGKVYVAEQMIIRKVADNGPAIFIGRCASEALKGKKGVLKVFITCSNKEEKVNRIINEYGINSKDVEYTIKKIDKRRSNYYHANTNKQWKDYGNYDLVLDSGKLGIEGCVVVLKALLDC